MLNEFGKFVRAYRIEHGMLLYDMAKALNVGSAYFSGCECERHPIPENWKQLLPEIYPDMDSIELMNRINSVNARFEGN